MSIWSTAISTIIPWNQLQVPPLFSLQTSSLARPEASCALFDDSTRMGGLRPRGRGAETRGSSKNARNKDGRGWKWKVSSAGVGLQRRRQRSVTVDTPMDTRRSPPSPSAKKPLKSVSLSRPADNNVPPLAPRYFFPPPCRSTHLLLSPRKYCAQPRRDVCRGFLSGPERIDSSYWKILFIFLPRIFAKIDHDLPLFLFRRSTRCIGKFFLSSVSYLCTNALDRSSRSFVKHCSRIVGLSVGCEMHRSRRYICYRSTRKFLVLLRKEEGK